METSQDLSRSVLGVVKRHYSRYDDSGNFMLHDYLHSAGGSVEACLYFELFCPDLVEIEGSVVLRRAVERPSEQARFIEYRRKTGRHQAERAFNAVEVPYLFGSGRGLSDDEDQVLAEAIAASWRSWISGRYPGRSFTVEVVQPEETGSVVGVQFYEVAQTGSGGAPSKNGRAKPTKVPPTRRGRRR